MTRKGQDSANSPPGILTRLFTAVLLAGPLRRRLKGSVLGGLAATVARQASRRDVAAELGDISALAEPLPPPAAAVADLHAEAVRLATAGADPRQAGKVIIQALKRAADDVACLNAATMLLTLLRKYRAAEHCARRATTLAPRVPALHVNMGNCLRAQGRHDEALGCYRQALELAPEAVDPHANCAYCLREMHREAEAIHHFQQALRLSPMSVPLRLGLGMSLLELALSGDAETELRKTLEMAPGNFLAWNHLGVALLGQHRIDEAIVCYQRALRIRPDFSEANFNLGIALGKLGENEEALANIEAAIAVENDNAHFHKTAVYTAVFCGHLTVDALKELHIRFGQVFANRVLSRPHPDATPERPLRIGYLSSDFRIHPVASNLLPALRHHDRASFSLHFYAHVRTPDRVTVQFRSLAAGWCDIRYLSDAEVAERIRADGIDILVCLAGRIDENRPAVCSYRAAPIQISMHDVATSGLTEMDYIVGDPCLIPRRTSEYFIERPLRLPRFYIGDFPDDAPPTFRPDDGQPAVFGCFNNPSKVTPAVLALWGRILAALPDSKLVLKYVAFYRSRKLQARVVEQLRQGGAAAEQIEIITEEERFDRFMAHYNDIDIALDPFPFSGSTTSFQALAMGVPVVTRRADRMVGRWTAAMLQQIGIPELIADSDEAYVGTAIAIARDVGQWRRRRQEISDRLANSSLCDGARWMRNMERFYRAVWRKHCAERHQSGREPGGAPVELVRQAPPGGA